MAFLNSYRPVPSGSEGRSLKRVIASLIIFVSMASCKTLPRDLNECHRQLKNAMTIRQYCEKTLKVADNALKECLIGVENE